jgi:hypothetical protein
MDERGSLRSRALGADVETTDHKTTDHSGIIAALAELPPDVIIDGAGLARIFQRHPVSIKRAIRRGELPPGVRLLANRPGRHGPYWTT